MKVLHYALISLALAMLMAFLGFGVLAGLASLIAKGFLALFVLVFFAALIAGFRTGTTT